MLPANVMGETFGQPAVEPDWKNLPRMPFMEFYQGLRERNWTSEYFVESSEPWKVDVFRDGGRSWKSSFWGKRILVTQLDGQQAWVNVPFDGAKSFLNTNLSGGRHGLYGGMQRKLFKFDLRQYGYNQLQEELEGAFQRRLPEEFNQDEVKKGISDDPNAYPYDCPGEYYLDVGFYRTPSEPDLVFFGRSSSHGVHPGCSRFRCRQPLLWHLQAQESHAVGSRASHRVRSVQRVGQEGRENQH
mmetsp:Transcript_8886/g.54648  ORF Transcript_8886/g.54648 Transcript_8886/m.54648 type:complete len:243 (+) Transcript_8886:365-1093(+)